MNNEITTKLLVGDVILQADLWATRAQNYAAEYQGLPEATIFLTFARQITALGKRVKELENVRSEPNEFKA